MSTPPRDPWHDAMQQWTASHDAPTAETPPAAPGERTVRLTRGRTIGLGVGGLALLALIALGWIFTAMNYSRADEWRDRSETLQRLVGERTAALNRQTARLNTAAKTLRSTRDALVKSEADVKRLEDRQDVLATEKAQVEDERALLQGIAGSLDRCNTGLRDIISAISAGEDPETTLDIPGISSSCEAADSAVRTYLGER